MLVLGFENTLTLAIGLKSTALTTLPSIVPNSSSPANFSLHKKENEKSKTIHLTFKKHFELMVRHCGFILDPLSSFF
jgi:hypothetical protein